MGVHITDFQKTECWESNLCTKSSEIIYLTKVGDRKSFLSKYIDIDPHYSFRHIVLKQIRTRTN